MSESLKYFSSFSASHSTESSSAQNPSELIQPTPIYLNSPPLSAPLHPASVPSPSPLESSPQSPYTSLMNSGIDYKNLAQFEDAISSFRSALVSADSDYNRMKSLCYIGSCYTVMKNHIMATDTMSQALGLARCPVSLGCAAYAQLRSGFTDSAVSLISECRIPLSSSRQIYYKLKYLLGVALTHKGSLPEALGVFHDLIDHNRGEHCYWCSCGIVYAKVGQYEEALQCFLHASGVSSARAESWYNLGLMYEKTSRLQEAYKAYGKAQSLDESSLAQERRAHLGASHSPLEGDYLHPEIDIASFLFEQDPKNESEKDIHLAKTLRVSESLQCQVRVLHHSCATDDKTPPMRPLVGLPHALLRGVSFSFMKNLVQFYQQVATRNKMQPEEEDGESCMAWVLSTMKRPPSAARKATEKKRRVT